MSELPFFSAKENHDNKCQNDRRKHDQYHHAKMHFRLPPLILGGGDEESRSNDMRPKIFPDLKREGRRQVYQDKSFSERVGGECCPCPAFLRHQLHLQHRHCR